MHRSIFHLCTHPKLVLLLMCNSLLPVALLNVSHDIYDTFECVINMTYLILYSKAQSLCFVHIHQTKLDPYSSDDRLAHSTLAP